jgi:hypothetical protein
MPLRWLTGARSSVIELIGTHLRRPEAEAIRKLVHRAVVGTGTFDPGCGDQMAADTTGTGLVARTSRRCSTACARRSSTTTDVSQSMQPSVMLRP